MLLSNVQVYLRSEKKIGLFYQRSEIPSSISEDKLG